MALTYEPIATQTLASTAGAIEFTSIPATYTDLRLVIVVTGSGGAIDIGMKLNGSSTAYGYTRINGNGSTATSSKFNSQTIVYIDTLVSATIPSSYVIDFMNYRDATAFLYRTFLWTQVEDKNGSGNAGRCVGRWDDTSAITSIRIGDAGTMAIGSTFTLYGIKNA
jgi:hypothetical protein